MILTSSGYAAATIEVVVGAIGAQYYIDRLAGKTIFIRHDGVIMMENGGNPLTTKFLR